MIYDNLKNIGNYLGIHPHLDTAIHYIMENDLNRFPLGRVEIDGDNVFLNVMEAQAAPERVQKYEFHKKYMDIQIDVIGTEIIQIGSREGMQVLSYGEDTDFGVVSCGTAVSCTMGPGNFIVCMAREPHRPGVAARDDLGLRKAVFKVRL